MHELRSFGRRRGRKLSERQALLMRGLLPSIAVDLSAPPPTDLSTLFPNPPPRVWLEIGFGGGEHLVWQAEHNPSVGIIGCEPFEDGVVKVLSAIDDKGLGNIRLHADDARKVLRWVPEASIDRVFILFPDPWPKRRHVKRRLVNPNTLDLVAHALKLGGELRIATDIGDYARTILIAAIGEPRLAWQVETAADWRERVPDWPETRYEQKAVREGRRRYFLRFRRI